MHIFTPHSARIRVQQRGNVSRKQGEGVEWRALEALGGVRGAGKKEEREGEGEEVVVLGGEFRVGRRGERRKLTMAMDPDEQRRSTSTCAPSTRWMRRSSLVDYKLGSRRTLRPGRSRLMRRCRWNWDRGRRGG